MQHNSLFLTRILFDLRAKYPWLELLACMLNNLLFSLMLIEPSPKYDYRKIEIRNWLHIVCFINFNVKMVSWEINIREKTGLRHLCQGVETSKGKQYQAESLIKFISNYSLPDLSRTNSDFHRAKLQPSWLAILWITYEWIIVKMLLYTCKLHAEQSRRCVNAQLWSEKICRVHTRCPSIFK